MATSREITDSRPITRDKSGKRTGTRLFQIEGTYPDAAPNVALTSGPPIPKPGTDRFPTDATLLCDRVTYEKEPGSVDTVRVTATYTNDGSGSHLPNIDPLDPSFGSWSIERRAVNEQIPYAVYDPTSWSFSDVNGNEKHVSAWKIETTPVRTNLEVIILRVNCEQVSYAEIQRVGDLSDTIVKLPDSNGRWYRFICGSFNEMSPGKWQVEYHFERDKGIADIVDPNQPPFGDFWYPAGIGAGDLAGPGYTGTYTRPPFHEIVVKPGPRVPNTDPVVFQHPDFEAIRTYPISPGSSFASLPGWR